MNTEKEHKKNYLKYAVFAAVIMALSCIMYMDASAFTNLLYNSMVSVYAGDSVDLSKSIDEEYIDINSEGNKNYTIEYKWNE